MWFNLLLLPTLYGNPDKSRRSKKQPAKKLNEQPHSTARRHHHDAIQSLRQFQQRYHLERRSF